MSHGEGRVHAMDAERRITHLDSTVNAIDWIYRRSGVRQMFPAIQLWASSELRMGTAP